MTNDAKLGLVIGMGLVIGVAVVFFHKDMAAANPVSDQAATNVNPYIPPPPALPRDQYRPVKARTMVRENAPAGSRQHLVREGDTLFNLAQQYYGDANQFTAIFNANRDVLQVPDPLVPGTVLVIPETPE